MFAMIVLNLFVAIILEAFDKMKKAEESMLSPIQITDFINTWKIFDKRASYFIKAIDFPYFMDKLPIPFGFKNIKVCKAEK